MASLDDGELQPFESFDPAFRRFRFRATLTGTMPPEPHLILCPGMALLRCPAQPLQSYGFVARHTPALPIEQSQLVLCLNMILVGRLLIAIHGLLVVACHAVPVGEL